MSTPKRLLAKGAWTPDAPKPSETLPGHTADVGTVARTVLAERGDAILESLGLDANPWRTRLDAAVRRAALAHDLGKGNSAFQSMVRAPIGTAPKQPWRHETLSVWLLVETPGLDEWLFGGVEPGVRLAALRAVLGHHVQFAPDRSIKAQSSGVAGVTVFGDHEDLRTALRIIAEDLALPEAPPTTRQSLSVLHALRGVRRVAGDVAQWWDGEAGDAWRRFAAAVAALVVACDVCGSAIPREGLAPGAWAEAALRQRCTGDDLRDAAMGRLTVDGVQLAPRPFQREVAASDAAWTLVTAGCGSGKTVAAYLWAARRCAGRKLFFTYPTTGTATEGFAGYALPEFERETALIHSRAELDRLQIEALRESAPEADEDPSVDRDVPADPAFRAERDRELRWQGLQLWPALVTVSTVDAVLGLVQNHRTGLFGFAALAGAGFIFDEVHLYDDRLFGALLRFLESVPGAPVLLMTATLPPARRHALEALAAKLGLAVESIAGPADLETMPRYRIKESERETAFAEALAAVRVGKRVLWVANTVGAARKVAEAAAVERAAAGEAWRIEPYHSRYRYCDRQIRHAAVVALFRPRRPGDASAGVLAVTTQVCEVSLDISADLLVTELAPPAALIQRLGRLNRWAKPGDGGAPRPGLVVDPDGHLPYSPDDLALGASWLEQVRDRETSQADLAAAFVSALAGGTDANRERSAWLDAAVKFERWPLREIEATVTVVRGEDAGRCKDSKGRPVAPEVTRYAVPMLFGPVAKEVGRWPTLGLARVAPEGRIALSDWGAEWVKR